MGWTSPALVGDGGLIAGHARVLAAQQLGIAEIPKLRWICAARAGLGGAWFYEAARAAPYLEAHRRSSLHGLRREASGGETALCLGVKVRRQRPVT